MMVCVWVCDGARASMSACVLRVYVAVFIFCASTSQLLIRVQKLSLANLCTLYVHVRVLV